eukprot:110173_1
MILLNHVFSFACLISLVLSNNDDNSEYNGVVDKQPLNNPEKPLPNEHVFDSNEPNPNDINEPNWTNTIRNVVWMSLYVQVGIVLCYIFVSRVCCINLHSIRFGDDKHPLKPWSVQNERIYNMSERKYLSKDDGIQSDGDFDTDPEDLQEY